MTREPSGCGLCLSEWNGGLSSGLLRAAPSPTPLRPQCSNRRGPQPPLTPIPGESEGLPLGRIPHTPVRGEGLPVLLPPGRGVHGGDTRAGEPHHPPQGRLHQKGLRAGQAHPGKVGGEDLSYWHTCHD